MKPAVLEPSRRFATLAMGIGVLVLVAAMLLGQRIGDRVIATGTAAAPPLPQAIVVTPPPDQAAGAYGPGWRRSYTLSAAGDPGFPDPRIPPQPLPTPLPRASRAPATPTPNPNIPIWRQQPLPTMRPAIVRTPGSAPPAVPSPTASP